MPTYIVGDIHITDPAAYHVPRLWRQLPVLAAA
jgi:hypothetical protein